MIVLFWNRIRKREVVLVLFFVILISVWCAVFPAVELFKGYSAKLLTTYPADPPWPGLLPELGH